VFGLGKIQFQSNLVLMGAALILQPSAIAVNLIFPGCPAFPRAITRQSPLNTFRSWDRNDSKLAESPLWVETKDLSNSEVVWFVVSFSEAKDGGFTLRQYEIHYTTLTNGVEGLTGGTPMSLERFERELRDRLSRPEPGKVFANQQFGQFGVRQPAQFRFRKPEQKPFLSPIVNRQTRPKGATRFQSRPRGLWQS